MTIILNIINLKYFSFFGVIVSILGIYIGFVGFQEYNHSESVINARYKYLYTLGNVALASDRLEAQLTQMESVLQEDPKTKQVLAQEANIKHTKLVNKLESNKASLEKQRINELANRKFDLLAYVSFSVSILIFGLSLFWRKRDMHDSKLFQQEVLTSIELQIIYMNKVLSLSNQVTDVQVVQKKKKKKKKKKAH